MQNLRRNRYIENLLNSSTEMWNNGISPLNMSQIEWLYNNTDKIVGILCKQGFLFSKYITLILLKNDSGNYVLFSPYSKKEKGIPHYLYDIIDIEEFINRYPIQRVYEDDDFSIELKEDLEKIKNHTTIGFIETRKTINTEVYNLSI